MNAIKLLWRTRKASEMYRKSGKVRHYQSMQRICIGVVWQIHLWGLTCYALLMTRSMGLPRYESAGFEEPLISLGLYLIKAYLPLLNISLR